MSRQCLRTGDKATVHFRFIKNPEYLHVGTRLVFREGRTKAIGNVSKLLTGVPPNIANKTKTKKILRQSAMNSGQISATNENVDNSGNNSIECENSTNNPTNKRSRGRHRGGQRHNKNYITENVENSDNLS